MTESHPRGRQLSKKELLAVLQDMVELVKANDSRGGTLTYSAALAPKTFVVFANYGTSTGEGGWRVIEKNRESPHPVKGVRKTSD